MAALGSTPGIIVGTGVGLAAGIALEPAFELPRQKSWQANPNRILDPGLMARLVAQGGVDLQTAHDDAARDGYGPDKLDALVYLAQTTPAVAEALTLWRRGLISDQLWQHVLTKAGLDARYVAGLSALKTSEPLEPAVIATAIQRSLMKPPFPLPVPPPTGEGKVKAFPVSPLDAKAEAAASGVDLERLFVATGVVGLPLSLQQAASAFFRGIIERADFDRAVAEGDTRNEWGPAALEQARQILSAHDAAELQLRGFLTRDERLSHTDQHGMAAADSDLLYDLLGRSIPVHQITTGEARGGVYKGPTDQIPEAYLSSLQRGNLRPEYYNLAYANRYSLPSAFVLRALLTDGTVSEQEGEQLFEQLGWPPALAKQVAAHYGGAKAAGADKHVAKAQTQLWTATHRSYVAREITGQDARAQLAALGLDAAAQDQVVTLWNAERDLIRRQLSPADIRKAVQEKVPNPATGQPWTGAEALRALLDRGYSEDEALTYLRE